jgi:3-deoxy-D-manno-octulosonic-acid transferase
MRHALDLAYGLLLFCLSPWILYKSIRTGKYRRGWWQKLTGQVPVRAGEAPCAWFHGVSVGEVHLLRPVVEGFRKRHPGWDCVISSTTDTGIAEARRCFPGVAVFYWPLDFSWAVREALERVKAALVVLAETELWPNFLCEANERGTPVAVVNGRMSPRSLRNYSRLGTWLRLVIGRVDLVLAQTQEYADAFRALGAPAERVQVTGSVKYDGAHGDRNHEAVLRMRRLLAVSDGDVVLVAGSTQDPEERLILSMYPRLQAAHPRLRLLLVPRHQERFEEVAVLLARFGVSFARRSRLTGQDIDVPPVVLVDSMGELGAVWGLADVAFVGGSLDGRRGGQNMIEPAAYGAAVLFGPHVWNFRDAAGGLVAAGGAIQVRDALDLEESLQRLLGCPGERSHLGESARKFVARHQGATELTIRLLEQLLERGAGRAAA